MSWGDSFQPEVLLLHTDLAFANPVEEVNTTLGCAVCTAREYKLCKVWGVDEGSLIGPELSLIPQFSHAIKPRRLIVREHDFPDAVPIICSGWAASVFIFPDGRRQILSFWLPGDCVWNAFDCADNSSSVVKAITPVTYRIYDKHAFIESVRARRQLFSVVLNILAAQASRNAKLIVDLGRGSAERRVAGLILDLAQRSGLRSNWDQGPFQMDFPLRQRHIADATGMTQAHAGKIIATLHKRNLIDIEDRTLFVLRPTALSQLAAGP